MYDYEYNGTRWRNKKLRATQLHAGAGGPEEEAVRLVESGGFTARRVRRRAFRGGEMRRRRRRRRRRARLSDRAGRARLG